MPAISLWGLALVRLMATIRVSFSLMFVLSFGIMIWRMWRMIGLEAVVGICFVGFDKGDCRPAFEDTSCWDYRSSGGWPSDS